MVTCKKCTSELPSTYRYCIYCGQKLPETEQNKKEKLKKDKLEPLQIGILLAAGLFVVAVLVYIFVLRK